MSIAQAQKLKDLEARIAEIEQRQRDDADRRFLHDLAQRLAALENRPKPGRPPKNG